jgi:hypothetical protein
MHGIEIVHGVFRALEEPEVLANPRYSLGGVVAELNTAQGRVAELMRQCDSGYWEHESDISLLAGATSYLLPWFIQSIKSIVTATGAQVWDQRGARTGYGVRLGHDRLIFESALTSAETWKLRYMASPWPARYGTLGTQGAGTSASKVELPAVNFTEGLSTYYDAYQGSAGVEAMGFGILTEASVSQQALITAYANDTRLLTLNQAISPVAASGNKFLIACFWPDLWADLLIYETALLLPTGPELVGGRYARAYELAMRSGRERNSGVIRQVTCDPET